MNMPQSGGGYAPHRGVMLLVLGILSIVFCQILGPIAWIMGKGDLAKINAGQMDPTGRDLTKVGMICGIIGTVLLALSVVLSLLWVVFVLILGAGMVAGAP